MIVLDTNVISEVFDGRKDNGIFDWLDRHDQAGLYITAITVAELVFGAELLAEGKRKQAFRTRIDQIVEDFEGRRLGFGDEAAYLYGVLSARRRNMGRAMETKDAMIAAICLQHGAMLATRNTKDFEGLDLKLVNPFEGA
jgi:predicted nucleic acid-binding protein